MPGELIDRVWRDLSEFGRGVQERKGEMANAGALDTSSKHEPEDGVFAPEDREEGREDGAVVDGRPRHHQVGVAGNRVSNNAALRLATPGKGPVAGLGRDKPLPRLGVEQDRE